MLTAPEVLEDEGYLKREDSASLSSRDQLKKALVESAILSDGEGEK
jgi:hypothetical protein